MWTFEQVTGYLLDANLKMIAVGYSGAGSDKNNPQADGVRNQGPIPRGVWDVHPPIDTQEHGPYAMALSPQDGTDTKGRSGFMIHGDSVRAPGTASEGCIILPRFARERVWESGDHVLRVVENILDNN